MMFFRRRHSIELLFDLDFASHILPEKMVFLGMRNADLSFYRNKELIASYVYPEDQKYFIIQYPQKWVLRFSGEDFRWKDIDNVTYQFTALDDDWSVIMSKSGKVKEDGKVITAGLF